jgi:DNA topoisomerase-3
MLILTEKPSVAKDFAAALNAKPAKKGVYQGNDLTITHCLGHLFELYDPEDYDPRFKKWRLEDLPIIPETRRFRVNKNVEAQTKTVIELLQKHKQDNILIATDAGREGEYIARICLLEAGITDISNARRFWVSEALTNQVIADGIKNAKTLSEYNGIAAQGFARAWADWLCGMNLSRLISIGNPPPAFSVGRVQTALLSAIADRNNEVKNFIPSAFKELKAEITSDNGVSINALLQNPNTGKSAFFDKDADYIQNALQLCETKPAQCSDVKSEIKHSKPEKLLNITGLQKIAYKKFEYTPEQTLNIAQELYETHKCLSYPRTPSRVMGDNNVELFLQKFESLKNSSPLSAFSDTSLINADNKHIFNSKALEDHHALIPLAPPPDNLTDIQLNIYNIVLDSFFTVCMKDFVYNEKSLKFNIENFTFTAKIREIQEQGWKASKQKNKDDKDDINDDLSQVVSSFNENNCSVKTISIIDKQTEPKKEFSLDSLLSFMENPRNNDDTKLCSLGTPATRADIIKKLFDKQYITESKKKLYSTERAAFLLQELSKNEHLKKIAMVSQTTEWESSLQQAPEKFEQEIISYIRDCCKISAQRGVYQAEPLGKCPVCGKPVTESKLAFGCQGYKDSPQCRFVIWKESFGTKITKDDVKLLLQGSKTKTKKCKKKDGSPFDAELTITDGRLSPIFKNKNT